MASDPYTLAQVLAVAKIHPFYSPDIQYPPDAAALGKIRNHETENGVHADLKSQPLLRKTNLYDVIQRLVKDQDPQNTYRKGVYTSITGGGSGKTPLFFATDVHENRTHRASAGQFLRATGIVSPDDCVVSTHWSGFLYRSLDLLSETLENAGATVLAAGSSMSPDAVVQLLIDFHANVLTGDSSQIVRVVHHIATMPPQERNLVPLDKIIYTSEVLTIAQRAHIKATLKGVKICSLLGSAEAGLWAVSSPDLTGGDSSHSTTDFIFDTRRMLIEILPPSHAEGGGDGSGAESLPDGQEGIIVQTSLSRLRHPLVRYITGDVGSLHPVPQGARCAVAEDDWPYLKLLRLEGRDRRFSFEWDGNYFQFENLAALLNDEECALLQWQVILFKMEPSLEAGLEVRLLCAVPGEGGESTREELGSRICRFFNVCDTNSHRFRLLFEDGLEGFERSATGMKVLKFVDRYNQIE